MTRRIGLLVFAMSLFSVPAGAQYFRSQISGFVRDTTQAVVVGATVTLEAPDIGLKRSIKTDSTGFYAFPSLPPGKYVLSAEAPGFKKFVETGIPLESATKIAVNAALEVGVVTQSVEVTAAGARVEVGTAEKTQTLTSRQLTEMPIPGRSVMSMVLLLPGMISRNGIIEDRGFSYSMGGWFLFGLRKHFNYITIDGLSDMQLQTLILWNNNLAPDFLDEFKVATSAYAAEYGRSVGVQMNAVTKSGTRAFHGSLWEFVRNDILNARTAMQFTKKAPYRSNTFGWTLGGPVYIPGRLNKDRDKLFFFLGQDFRRVMTPAERTGIVPTALERVGNFSGSTMALPKDITTHARFPGDIITAGGMGTALSLNGKALASVYPLPNFTGPGGNYHTALSSPVRRSSTIMRVDYVINQKWRLSLRNLYDYQDSTDPIGGFGGALPIQGSEGINKSYNTQGQLLTVFNPTTMNEFLFGYSGYTSDSLPYPGFATRAAYGVTYPELIAGNVGNILPNVNITGLSFLGMAATPSIMRSPSYHWRDNFSKVLGRHSLKFGIYIEKGAHRRYNRAADNGAFNFNVSTSNPKTTGNGLADLLLGNFDSYSEGGAAPYNDYRVSNYEFYAQDTWKARSNLTVEYGMRYSLWPPYTHAYNAMSAWNPNYFDPTKVPQMNANGSIVPGTGDLYNGVVLPGVGFTEAAQGRVAQVGNPDVTRLFRGLPNGYSTMLLGGVGPRLGVSWDPRGKGKTAVRAGIGLVQGRSDMEAITGGLPDYPPFTIPSLGVTNGPVDNPGQGLAVASLVYPQSFRLAILEYKNPSVVNWHFSIQHELPGQILADVGYMGNTSVHNSRGRQINALHPAEMQALAGKDLRPYYPYKGLGGLASYEGSAGSHYNALQVRVSRRFERGFLFNVSYTLAKALGDAQDRWDQDQDPFQLRHDYGYNEDDRRNVLVISSVYELPFFKNLHGAPGYVLKGWEVTSTIVLNSGRHFNPGLTGAANQIASRPDLIGRFALPKGEKTLRHFFNTAAFARPAAWTYGNAARNILVGPGTNNWDIMIAKNTRVRERVNVQFRCEMFNAFNHPSYNGINTTFGASAFGQVNGVNYGRMVQLAMKLVF